MSFCRLMFCHSTRTFILSTLKKHYFARPLKNAMLMLIRVWFLFAVAPDRRVVR